MRARKTWRRAEDQPSKGLTWVDAAYLPVEAILTFLEGEQKIDGACQARHLVLFNRMEATVVKRAVQDKESPPRTYSQRLSRAIMRGSWVRSRAPRRCALGLSLIHPLGPRTASRREARYLSKAYWRRPSWRGRVPCVPLQPRNFSPPSLHDFFHPTNRGLTDNSVFLS